MNQAKIEQLRNQFYKDGYLVLPSVLPLDQCERLKADLQRIMAQEGSGKSRPVYIYKRLFEKSDENLLLFAQEPIVTLAEAIIAGVHPGSNGPALQPVSLPATLQCHVIHNNGMVVPPGCDGIHRWHQDDAPHFIVQQGEVPTNIHLPVLVLTVNYYLGDVTREENGPTMVVPGSHLFGKPCPINMPDKYKTVSCLGPAGTAVLFNCQLWHKGSANTSDATRWVSQVTYARRIIGHKYFPFMNYQLPDHVREVASLDPRLKRLVGFLDSGPYG